MNSHPSRTNSGWMAILVDNIYSSVGYTSQQKTKCSESLNRILCNSINTSPLVFISKLYNLSTKILIILSMFFLHSFIRLSIELQF